MYQVYFSIGSGEKRPREGFRCWHPALTFEFVNRAEAIATAKALKTACLGREFAVTTRNDGWIYRTIEDNAGMRSIPQGCV